MMSTCICSSESLSFPLTRQAGELVGETLDRRIFVALSSCCDPYRMLHVYLVMQGLGRWIGWLGKQRQLRYTRHSTLFVHIPSPYMVDRQALCEARDKGQLATYLGQSYRMHHDGSEADVERIINQA